MKLIKKIKKSGTLTLLSGLHIGASKESADIGGVDSPVIRLKKDKIPYIPGSSLKGKIRCLLEQSEGASNVGDSEKINKVFGITERKEPKRKAELTRVIFRDGNMTTKSVEEFKLIDTDMPLTEVKFENTIDRIKGATKKGGLRQIERVPAGAKFKVEIIVNIYEGDNERDIFNMLDNGFDLIENDYLGGSGTRGYGHIKFEWKPNKVVWPKENTES